MATQPHSSAHFQVNRISGATPEAVAVPASGPTGLILLVTALWFAAGVGRYLSRRGRT